MIQLENMETLHKKSLLGDVETHELSPENNWFFIIERILEFGDIDDLKWMKMHFTPEDFFLTHIKDFEKALEKIG